jgi:hypothetical protein
MPSCGRDLVAARGPGTINIAYPRSVGGPKADKLFDPRKPLLFVFLWFTKTPRVTGVVIVLVHGAREKVQIHRLESPNPFVNELDLWGIGALWASHLDVAAEGAKPEASRKGYIAYPQARCQPVAPARAVDS